MKKLFISVPMKGRTEEAIRESMDKMHRIAEAIVGEELARIDSYIEHDPPKDAVTAVWYLGESIKQLAGADYMIRVDADCRYSGCNVEYGVAREYGIPTLSVDLEYVCPDIIEAQKTAVPTCGVPIGY